MLRIVGRSRLWLAVVGAASLALGACAGGGGQSFSSVMPPGGGQGLGPGPGVPSGATVLRVHLPWPANGSLPAATPPGGRGGMGTMGGGLMPFTTPTPLATPTPPVPGSPNAAASPFPVQALQFGINGPTQENQTLNLGAGAPGCVPGPSGTVCQLMLPLAPGAYTATVGAYSSPAISPANLVAPVQTIAFAVTQSGANVVNLSIGAVPASVDVVPASSMSVQTAQDAIDMYGAGKHPMLVELLDASQNVIVGANLPAFVVSQAGGALGVSLVQPTINAPNLFYVSPPAAYNGGSATLRVAAGAAAAGGANPCALPAASCNGTQLVDVRQLLAVANAGGNTVTLYAGTSGAPVATLQSGVTQPQALVFDASGDLFVANQLGGISEFTPPYANPPNSIGVGVSHPQALALDGRGNLFVANGSGSNTVTEYAPPYTGAPAATISSGVNDPVSLALDSAANLYVVNQAANTVTQYAPPYGDPVATIANGLSGPNSIAVDARGNLFVSNLNSTPNAVLQYSPPFSNASVPAAWITNGVNEQGALGVGATGNLFVPNQGSNTVTEYAAPFNGAPTVITGGQSQPVAIAVDALANLYVANYGNNTVTEYPPPYAGVSWVTISNGVSNPMALALSPPST